MLFAVPSTALDTCTLSGIYKPQTSDCVYLLWQTNTEINSRESDDKFAVLHLEGTATATYITFTHWFSNPEHFIHGGVGLMGLILWTISANQQGLYFSMLVVGHVPNHSQAFHSRSFVWRHKKVAHGWDNALHDYCPCHREDIFKSDPVRGWDTHMWLSYILHLCQHGHCWHQFLGCRWTWMLDEYASHIPAWEPERSIYQDTSLLCGHSQVDALPPSTLVLRNSLHPFLWLWYHAQAWSTPNLSPLHMRFWRL